MPNPPTIDAVGPSVEEESQIKPDQAPKGPPVPSRPRTIRVGVGFVADGNRIIVYDAPTKLRARSKVIIRGYHLNIYDQVLLRAGTNWYRPIDLRRAYGDNEPISFLVPNFNKILSDGDAIWIRLVSKSSPRATGVVAPYSQYSTKTEEEERKAEEEAKKAAQGGEAAGGAGGAALGPTAIALGAAGEVIGGIAKAFAPGKTEEQKFAPQQVSGAAPGVLPQQAGLEEEYAEEEYPPQEVTEEVETAEGIVAPETIKQASELVGEYLDKNPEVIVSRAARENVLEVLGSGDFSRLTSEGRTGLEAVLKSQAVVAGAGQAAALQAAFDIVQNAVLTEQTQVASRAEAEVPVAAKTQVSAQFQAASKVEAEVSGEAKAQVSVSVQAGAAAAALAGGLSLSQSRETVGEFLDKNPQTLPITSDREAVLQALASGDFTSLSPQQNAGFQTFLQKTAGQPQIQSNPRLAGAFSNLQLMLEGKLPQAEIEVPSGVPSAPQATGVTAEAQIATPRAPSEAAEAVEKTVPQVAPPLSPAPPEIAAQIAKLKEGNLPPELGVVAPGPKGKREPPVAGEAAALAPAEAMAGGLGPLVTGRPLEGILGEQPAAPIKPEAGVPAGTPKEAPSGPLRPAELVPSEKPPEGEMPTEAPSEEQPPLGTAERPAALAPVTGGEEPAGLGGEGGMPVMPSELAEPVAMPRQRPGEVLDQLRGLAGGKVAGKASSKIWYAGLGSSAAVWFSGLDFFAGALIMDAYWIFGHKKDKELFPLKAWQKTVTVFANIAPFLYIGFFLILIFYAGCNFPPDPSPSVFRALGYGGVCDALKSVSSGTFSGGESGGGGASSGWECESLTSGPASVDNLKQTCFDGNADKASAIAGAESGGEQTNESGVDKCKDGNSFSIGLFQINMIAHGGKINSACSKNLIFRIKGSGTQGDCLQKNNNGVCVKYDCEVIDLGKYNSCKSSLKDANININLACQISGNGQNWSAWGANKKCAF